MLEFDFNNHLGYHKNQKSPTDHVQNGTGEKSIHNSLWDSWIQVPRYGDSSFNSMLIPKRKSTLDGLENVMISLYEKGMINSDADEQIREGSKVIT